MAKGNTTITQGYGQGARQIIKFIKGEIGSGKEARARLDKLQLQAVEENKRKTEGKKSEAEMYEMFDEMAEQTKVKHHQNYKIFKAYGKKLMEFFTETPPDVTYYDAEELGTFARDMKNHKLFNDKNLKWKSESGIKAVGKFADVLLENDAKKFDYYKKCVSEGGKTFKMEKVLSAPTPAIYDASEAMIDVFAVRMRDLQAALAETEGGFHINSSEFNRMMNAIKAVNQGFESGIAKDELGSRFEELQAASMNYVKAKGVGTQSSQRGKDRMDAALDICAHSAEGMDYFMSKERLEAVKAFELENFGKTFDYELNTEYIEPLTAVYSIDENFYMDM